MAVETDVLDELRRLRTRVPGLAGSLAATVDGLVLAHDVPRTEPEGLAALTAAALGVAHRMTDAAGRGSFRELLVRGAHGYIATYAVSTTAVLTLLADDRVNVGSTWRAGAAAPDRGTGRRPHRPRRRTSRRPARHPRGGPGPGGPVPAHRHPPRTDPAAPRAPARPLTRTPPTPPPAGRPHTAGAGPYHPS
ncbi:roadblock/LC7 domain-containing protein [Streptomyces sp. MMS20-AI2-20]|nr:roadblock/LC7 domain-containing protein [Streptomyces sp. MMS20-AI2-20]